MTRTNRSMREPAMIPPPLNPSLAGLIEDQRRRIPSEAGSTDDDAARGMVMLSAALIAGMAVALLIVFGWSHHHYTQGRIDRLQAGLQDLHTFTSCTVPPKPGDTLVITVRRHADQLATRCQLLTNPMQPERAFQ